MHYISSRCSKCGNIIRPLSRVKKDDMEMFGRPFIQCPLCKTILINNHKEFIMLKKGDKIKYHLPTIIWGVPIGLIIGAVFTSIISDNKLLLIIFIILFILLIEIILWIRCEDNFNCNKEKSIERTRNKEYIDMLLALKLIDKSQYDSFVAKYGLNSEK